MMFKWVAVEDVKNPDKSLKFGAYLASDACSGYGWLVYAEGRQII
jgi:hypothetical protein